MELSKLFNELIEQDSNDYNETLKKYNKKCREKAEKDAEKMKLRKAEENIKFEQYLMEFYMKTDTIKKINELFFRCLSTWVIVQNGRIEALDDKSFEKTFANKLSDLGQKYIEKHLTDIYTVCCSTEKYLIDRERLRINVRTSHRFEDSNVKKFDMEFIEDFREHFLKVQICNNNENAFKLIEKWISCVCNGRKTKIGLMFVSATGGVYKTVFTEVLNALLGDACCQTKSSDFMRFNSSTLGKTLAIIEELPDADKEMKCLVEELKKMITNSKYKYEKKGKDSVDFDCIENVIIASNNAISYFERKIMRITPNSTLTKINKTKLNEILDKFNGCKKIQEMLYCYYRSKDDGKWDAQQDKSTIDDYINSCENLCDMKLDKTKNSFKFVVDQFRECKLSGSIKKTDFYETFKKWCVKKQLHSTSKGEFYEQVSELGMKTKTKDGYILYDLSVKNVKELEDELKARNFLNIDEVIENKKDLDALKVFNDDEDEDKVDEEKEHLKSIINKKEETIKQLQEQIQQLFKKQKELEKKIKDKESDSDSEEEEEEKPRKKVIVKKTGSSIFV